MCADTLAAEVPVRPRGFDEGAPRPPIAGFRDAALPACGPARVLGWNEAHVGGQLAGIVEAREVAELRDDGDRHEPLHPAERLERLHHGGESPARCEVAEIGLEPLEAIDLFIDGSDGFLKHDLLRGCGAHHFREIATVGGRPIGSTHVVQAKAEQERPSTGASHP